MPWMRCASSAARPSALDVQAAEEALAVVSEARGELLLHEAAHRGAGDQPQQPDHQHQTQQQPQTEAGTQ